MEQLQEVKNTQAIQDIQSAFMTKGLIEKDNVQSKKPKLSGATKIIYNDVSRVGELLGDKIDSTISYLQRHAKLVKDTRVFAADYAGATQEEKAKRNKAMRKLHDRDVAELASQLNSEKGLDKLERIMSNYQKKTEREEKQGKHTQSDSINMQALHVHDMLAMFTILQSTHDIEKAKKYLEFYNPTDRSRDKNKNAAAEQMLNDVASILEADGVEIKGSQAEQLN